MRQAGIVIASGLANELRAKAARAAPREVCGVVTGEFRATDSVLLLDHFQPVVNLARDHGFFVVRISQVAPLASNAAFFHSHVDRDAKLSLHDRRASVTLGGLVIVASWLRSTPSFSAYHYDHGSIPVALEHPKVQPHAGSPRRSFASVQSR